MVRTRGYGLPAALRLLLASLSTVAASAAAASAAAASAAAASAASAPPPLYLDPDAPVDARVADLLARMTLDEKVAQLLEPFPGEYNSSELLARFGSTGVGAVYATGLGDGLLAPDMYGAIGAFQSALAARSRLGIPTTIVAETLHSSGASTRDNGTAFPGPASLGASFNTSLVAAVGAVIGSEARAGGFLRGNAPVLQVVTDPRFGRFEEAFGECPFLVARMGVAMLLGQQGPTAGGGASDYLNDTPWPTRSQGTTSTERTSASERCSTCTCGRGARPSARAACAASWSRTRRPTACRCTARGTSSRAFCAARPLAARSSSWRATRATSRT
jgi:hypothetical protein